MTARGTRKARSLLHLYLVPEPTAEPPPLSPAAGHDAGPANVRLATIRDEPAILELLLADLDERADAVRLAPASVSHILQSVQLGTRQKGGFCPVIDGPDGSPVAVAVLVPDCWWWSETIHLREIVLYVRPDARHSQHGADLIRYECWLADQLTMTCGQRVFAFAGVTGTDRMAAKERLYARHMTRIGAFYLYPSPDGLQL